MSIFDLHSGALASYRWSTNIITVSPFARYTHLTPLEVAHGVLGLRVATWNTDLEFRAVAALVHEFCHYQQDILTGTGHRDFLIARGFDRMFMGLGDESPLEPSDEETLRAASGYPSMLWRSQARRRGMVPPEMEIEGRRAQVTRALEFAHVAQANVEALTLRNLLELEAYGLTTALLSGTCASEEQSEIMLRNMSAFSIAYSPEPVRWLLNYFMTNIQMPSLTDATFEQILYAQVLISFLTDCVLAAPTPAEHPLEEPLPDADLPEVKFVRYVAAIRAMHGPDFDIFQQRVVSAPEEAERMLMDRAGHRTPSAAERRRGWARELAPFLKRPVDDYVAFARADAAKAVASSSLHILHHRKASAILELGLHMFLACDDEFLVYTFQSVDFDERMNFVTDHITFDNHLSIVEFMAGVRPFRCQLGAFRRCTAATNACREGVLDLSALPTIDDNCHTKKRFRSERTVQNINLVSKTLRKFMQPDSRLITEEVLGSLTADARKVLAKHLAPASALNVDPAFINDIAVRVITGIVSGFVSRVVYDEYVAWVGQKKNAPKPNLLGAVVKEVPDVKIPEAMQGVRSPAKFDLPS